MLGKGPDAYQKTNVLTADPKRLVIMCYEGAIAHLNLAKEKYLEGKYEAKAKSLKTVQDAINELLCALDFEGGGEIATNLHKLYLYMQSRLTSADVNRDLQGFEEVLGMLKELKDTWEEIFFGSKKDILDTQTPAIQLSDKSSNQGRALTYGPSLRL